VEVYVTQLKLLQYLIVGGLEIMLMIAMWSNFKRLKFDWQMGKCSNIPICCRLFYIFIWPWYIRFNKNVKYVRSPYSQAEYIECWFCKYCRIPRKLKYCEECEQREFCPRYKIIQNY
jgi:hypothetical protein